MKRSYWILSSLMVVVLVLTACGGGGAAGTPTAAVDSGMATPMPIETEAGAGEEVPTLAATEPAATEAAGEATAGAPTAAAGGAGGEGQTIRVATDATWPPFEIVDEETKEIVGFDIDLMKAIAEKANLQVEFVNVGFDPLLAGIAQCQYDAAISSITITDERKQSMLFSDPYFDAGQVITVAADNADIQSKDDLAGKTVGAQIGTTGAIEAQNIEGAELNTYDTIDLAFQDLINGQVDAVIADNPLALGFVGQNPDQLKVVGDVFTTEQYGIAVCNDNQELVEQINQGLAEVKEEGLIDELTEKWITSAGQQQ